MTNNHTLLKEYISYKSSLGFNCKIDSSISLIEFNNMRLHISTRYGNDKIYFSCTSVNDYNFRKKHTLFQDFKNEVPYPEYFKGAINIECKNHANYILPFLDFTLDANILLNYDGYRKLDAILKHFNNNIDEILDYYERLEPLDNNFRNYFYNKKKSLASYNDILIEGPFTNGSYAVDYLNDVRILMWPNLYIKEKKFFVMDFICIPNNLVHKLRNQYIISKRLISEFPYSDYLYGNVTIESDLTYTSCLRFSLFLDIISDFSGFVKLDAIFQYIKNHIHNIMEFYEEIEDSVIQDDTATYPSKQMFEYFMKMLEQK